MDEDNDLAVIGLFKDEPLPLFLIEKFLGVDDGHRRRLCLPALRLAHLWHAFSRIREKFPLKEFGQNFTSELSRIMGAAGASLSSDAAVADDADDGDELYLRVHRRLVEGWSDRNNLRLFKALEVDSRGQSRNAAWHMLRVDTVSATKFYNALVSGTWLVDQDDSRPRSESIVFGTSHEPVVKAVLEYYVMKDREVVRGGLGLLIEPTSGLLGASVDACFGLRREKRRRRRRTEADDADDADEDREEASQGPVTVGAGAVICEIKCRYKYLRPRDDPYVAEILRDGASRRQIRRAVVKFLMSHPVPGVEYRADVADVPTGRDFLLSFHEAFRTDKRSRPGTVPDFLKGYMSRLLDLNKNERSLVVVFDTELVPDQETINDGDRADFSTAAAAGCLETANDDAEGWAARAGRGPSAEEARRPGGAFRIYEKVRFDLPVFANPRHPYYFQTLVQQYVVGQYYISEQVNPELIEPRDLPSVRLVSAVLRRRSPEELGRLIDVGGRSFDCDHVPLILIVTPVAFDRQFIRDAVNTVTNKWEREILRRTGVPVWVPNAVNEYLTSLETRPPTP